MTWIFGPDMSSSQLSVLSSPINANASHTWHRFIVTFKADHITSLLYWRTGPLLLPRDATRLVQSNT